MPEPLTAHATAYDAAHEKIRSAVIVDETMTVRQIADRALDRLECYLSNQSVEFDSIELIIRNR